jgi:DNA repair protein RecN (Recombination protein N)
VIEEIRIENLGVIASAHLEFSPALTVITGETGAGKTMVLSGLGLLLGGRADPAAVRVGAPRAVVEGVVTDPGEAVLARAADAGADLDEGVLLIARTVAAEGRSRAHLGGRSVPQTVLADLAADLVTVHGQADQMRLRSPAQQRSALDAFAGTDHLATLAEYRAAHAERARARAALDRWDEEASAREQEVDRLEAGLRAIETAAPQPGEDVALREEADRLANVEDLRAAASVARGALSGDEAGRADGDAIGAVDAARRALEQVAALDARLADAATRLGEIAYVLGDTAVELGGYLADLDADPARLAAVHERRAVLAELTRRYAPAPRGEPARPVDDVLAWAEDARRRLTALGDPVGTRETLALAVADAEARLAALAGALSAGRAAAAAALSAAVDAELTGLAMRGAHLEVRLDPLVEPGPWGADDVEMLLAAHAGAPARPLGRGASGGELSRVMLALEVALATAPRSGPGGPGTFVFDEVDAGVGGRAAVEVGRRLADLGRSAQVIVITHLAQVAAFADRHLVVTKTSRDGSDLVTDSGVRAVEGEERLQELARMLSGQEESDLARRHAAELLDLPSWDHGRR